MEKKCVPKQFLIYDDPAWIFHGKLTKKINRYDYIPSQIKATSIKRVKLLLC